MTILITFGAYGGFYFDYSKGFSFRMCLGWAAITIMRCDLEKVLSRMKEELEGLK